MLADERLFVLLGAAEGGEIIGSSDIAEHHADVAQQAAPFHAHNGTFCKAALEFRLGNFEEVVE